jgi:hypothetical protein
MTTTINITTEELIAAFAGETSGKIFEATYIPNGAEYPSVPLWDRRYFKAANKAEAVKIAREYGKRIIGKKMIYVYLAGKSGV